MEYFDLVINEGFSSNFIDQKLFSLKNVSVLVQYPSVLLTQAAIELAKVLPLFGQIESFSLNINPYCVIHNQGYTKITKCLKNLKQLKTFQLKIGSNCLFDKNIIYQFKTSLENLENLEDLYIKIDRENQLLENCLKWISQIFNKTKNIQKLNLEIQEHKCINNQKFIQLCNGLSKLQNLKELSLDYDFINLDNNSSIFFEKSLQSLQNLQSLSLIGKNFKYSRFKNIFMTFKYLSNLSKIVLCLDCKYQLTVEDIQDFAQNFSYLTNLKEVQLKGNVFETLGKYSFPSVIMNMNGLEKFVFEFPFKNKDSHNYLEKNTSHLKNLKEFSIKTQYKLNSDQQIITLTTVFAHMKLLQSLELNFQDQQLKSIELESLGNSFNVLLNLIQLKLNLNSFDNNQNGLIIFYEGLSNLKSLTNLELDISLSQQKKQQTKRDFGKVLKKLQSLQKLKFSFNGYILGKELKSIESEIGQLINLEELDLQIYSNDKKKKSSSNLFESINQLSKLKYLQLNNISLKNNINNIEFNDIQNQKQNYEIVQPVNNTSFINYFNNLKTIFYQIPIFKKQQLNNDKSNVLEKYNNQLGLSINLCKLKNFMNIIELDLDVIVYNQQSAELIDLSESFQKMKNLINLRLQINSKKLNYEVQQNSLIKFANGIKNLINLQFITLKFDFKNKTREDQIYQKIFQNLTNLLQIDITFGNLSKDVLIDLKEGMRYQNQLENFTFQKIIFHDNECVDYLAELISFIPNLKWLCFKEYPSKFGSEKLLDSINSLKKLISFEITESCQNQKIETTNLNEKGVDQLYIIIKKQICNQINQQFSNQIVNHNIIKNSIIPLQDKQEDLMIYNGLYSHEYNVMKLDDYYCSDNPVIRDMSELIFLQKLIIRFKTRHTFYIDKQQLQHLISSFKFLVEFRIDIDEREENDWDCYSFYIRPIQLRINQINAIGKGLLSLSCLEKLQLKLENPFTSHKQTKIQLSHAIGNQKNLKYLILQFDFKKQHLEEFNSNIAFKSLQKLNTLKYQIGRCYLEKLQIDYTNCFSGLKYLTNLIELDICVAYNSEIGQKVPQIISDGICQMTNLESLQLKIDGYKNLGNEGAISILGLETYLKKLNKLKSYKIQIEENMISSDILSSFSNFQNYQIDEVQIDLSFMNDETNHQLYCQYQNIFKILTLENEFKISVRSNQIKLNGYSHLTNSSYMFNFRIQYPNNQFLSILAPLQNKQQIEILSLDIDDYKETAFDNSLLHISESLRNIKELNINTFNFTQLYGDFLQKLQQLQKLTISFPRWYYCQEFFETLPKLNNLEYLKLHFDFQQRDDMTNLKKLNTIQKNIIQMDKLRCIILQFRYAQQSKYSQFNSIKKYIKRLVSFYIKYNYQ